MDTPLLSGAPMTETMSVGRSPGPAGAGPIQKQFGAKVT